MPSTTRRVTSGVGPSDPDYPRGLRDLDEPDLDIVFRGTLPTAPPAVAIVGSRRATPEARSFTHELARDLARAGVAVISGGALGIDSAAHEGALAADAATWVILATSPESPTPRTNHRLFRRILDGGGGLLAESRPAPGRFAFVRRNRLVAALCDLVVVVQGDERSGTRHTVEFARSLGRVIAAVPWCPWDARGRVPCSALRQGGLLVTGAAPILERLGLPQPPPEIPSDPVLEALGTAAMTLDQLARTLGITPRQTRILLGRLEVEGRVQQRAGRYLRSS